MDGGRQGDKRGVGAARRRSRGHGPARLDGTRPRATVASKVMESGKTAEQGNGHPFVPTARKRSAQARSWKPGRRRQPSSARERWKPEWGEMPKVARCAARQRDRPCFLAGDARTSTLDEQNAQDRHHATGIGKLAPRPLRLRIPGRAGAAGSAALRGAKLRAAGIARRAFPWRQAKRAASVRARRHQAGLSSGCRLDSETGIQGEDEFSK